MSICAKCGSTWFPGMNFCSTCGVGSAEGKPSEPVKTESDRLAMLPPPPSRPIGPPPDHPRGMNRDESSRGARSQVTSNHSQGREQLRPLPPRSSREAGTPIGSPLAMICAGLASLIGTGLFFGGFWWMNYATDLAKDAAWFTNGAKYNEFHILGLMVSAAGAGIALIGLAVAALGWKSTSR